MTFTNSLDKNLGNDAYYVGLIILSSLWITGAIMISIMFSGNKNKFGDRMTQQRNDITKIFNAFITLMNAAEKSVFHSKSMQIHGLQLVDELYIRAQTGKMSYLGSPVLIVATISVKSPGRDFSKSYSRN
jgi:hypothetical protein